MNAEMKELIQWAETSEGLNALVVSVMKSYGSSGISTTNPITPRTWSIVNTIVEQLDKFDPAFETLLTDVLGDEAAEYFLSKYNGARLMDTLQRHWFTDCNDILGAIEYQPDNWIFVSYDETGEWAVNLFVNGDFAGEPLETFSSYSEARAYQKGWLACLSK